MGDQFTVGWLSSLLGTLKLNNNNPETYLRHVLSVIAEYPVNKIEDLLPWDFKLSNID